MPKKLKDGLPQRELYVVHDLIDWKEEDGNQEFLVWWKGYPKADSTWEPIQNIQYLQSDWEEQMEMCRQLARQRDSDKNKTKKIRATQRKKIEDEVKLQKKIERQKRMQRSIELLANMLVKQSRNYAKNEHQMKGFKSIPFDNDRIEEEQKEQQADFVFERVPIQVFQISISNTAQNRPALSENTFFNNSGFHPFQKKTQIKTGDFLNQEQRNSENIIQDQNSIQLQNFSYEQKQGQQSPDNEHIDPKEVDLQTFFKGLQLQEIVDSFTHNNDRVFELKLKHSLVKQLIMYEDSVRTLWPEQLAEYLSFKQQAHNQQYRLQ